MRKFMVLAMAGLLVLAIAGPVSAGANVGNYSGSATTAQGSWYSEGAQGFTFGYLAAWQEEGATSAFIDFYQESGNYVDCTPDDENEDFYGFQGTFSYGWGEGSLNVGRGYADASATGTIGIETTVIDDCVGTYDSTFDPEVVVTLDLTATGPKVMERGTWSFQIPSQYNSHSSYSSTYRTAAGTATIGGDERAVDGGIGKVSWRDHSNG
jgi:hypothetical protein